MALPKRALSGIDDRVDVNVFDIRTKQIVFSGNQCQAARYLAVHQANISQALRTKYRIKKNYVVRTKSV